MFGLFNRKNYRPGGWLGLQSWQCRVTDSQPLFRSRPIHLLRAPCLTGRPGPIEEEPWALLQVHKVKLPPRICGHLGGWLWTEDKERANFQEWVDMGSEFTLVLEKTKRSSKSRALRWSCYRWNHSTILNHSGPKWSVEPTELLNWNKYTWQIVQCSMLALLATE